MENYVYIKPWHYMDNRRKTHLQLNGKILCGTKLKPHTYFTQEIDSYELLRNYNHRYYMCSKCYDKATRNHKYHVGLTKIAVYNIMKEVSNAYTL